MEDFYKKWLKNFATQRNRYYEAENQVGGNEPDASESADESDADDQQIPTNPSEIVYVSGDYKLIVEKSNFKKQKLFRLQDHLFKFKVIQTNTAKDAPLLSDLFDFLNAALVYVLESIKHFYKKEDRNIAYLTLHQEPMVNGLNTGFSV